MKPKINTYTYLNIPIYECSLLLVYGDYTYVTNLLKKLYGLDCNYDTCYACIEIIEKGHIIQYIMFISNEWDFATFDYGVLAHEAFHLAHRILESKKDHKNDTCITITEDTREPIAYLIEAIVTIVLKALVKLKKKGNNYVKTISTGIQG